MDLKAKKFYRNEVLKKAVKKWKSLDADSLDDNLRSHENISSHFSSNFQGPQSVSGGASPGGNFGSGGSEEACLLSGGSGGKYQKPTDFRAFLEILQSNYVSLFLVFVPFAIFCGYLKVGGDLVVFLLNFFAIIPLAWLLGKSTEELSLRTNQTFGGLLNATFGNAVEIILSITALKNGMIRVVQTSLLGSIFSNLLLVLGMCFVCGGLKYREQKFNSAGASTFCSLLKLSCLAIIIPSAFTHTMVPKPDPLILVYLSRGTALLLLVVYGLYLVFQLKTHSHLFQDEANTCAGSCDGGDEEEKELLEEPVLSLGFSIGLLSIVTVFVAFCSEYLMDTLEAVTSVAGLNQTFLGMILLPIVGNAAEHVTAITVAMKNKMDLSIGVAVGSSTQIAMFVIPLMVLVGWGLGVDMTLSFDAFETIVLMISVMIVNAIIVDGESNWLEGVMLLFSYFMIAVSFYYYPTSSLS